jgi:hypothetical protein
MTDNMKVWKVLGVTDPKHTKKFKRAGGFSGDAIKPMYAIQKMTELFGPCGIGWGYTKPEYQTVSGTEGQLLVYCTVGLWHATGVPSDSILDEPRSELVYGVGGDFVIVKQSAGLRSDDEAFKKAFTDALMNAMKHIGMSADVHMGQFDGDKYTAPVPAQPKPEKVDLVNNEEYNFYRLAIPAAKDLKELQDLFAAAWTLAKGDEPARVGLTKAYNERKAQLTQQENK